MMSLIMMLIFMLFLIMVDISFKTLFFSIQIMLVYYIMIFKYIIINKVWLGIYLLLGVDMYSLSMCFLSLWIIMLMLISLKYDIYYNFYMFIILILLLMLVFCFLFMNYLMFYIFFESSMIPTLLLIIGWGGQPERVMAGYYMFIYMMFSSLPMLIIMFMLKNNFISMNYLILMNQYIYYKFFSFLFYFFMIFAFLVKLPMFIFHLWLPKAHVEAPLVGSMVLAGVMLKLGSYGLIRSILMMMNLSMNYNIIFMIMNLWGGVILSLICFIQIDMKMLVAYSSIVHMSVMLIGIFSMMFVGYLGAYLMMIAHGICSSGLFYLVNMNYIRMGSRMFIMNKGLMMFFPNVSLWWFMFCISNMSSPFSLNLFSEIMVLFSIFNYSFFILLLMILIMFFSSLYNIYMYMLINHGKMNFYLNKFYFNSIIEYMVLILHWVPLNLLFLNLFFFI
uniref:NADH-ubiquinone oxidoreductase chain 4 n=1 Tax=Belyta sp. ZJUH_2016005 TaxID=2491151 RepID=A0A3S5HLN4_9HYME|nr:NADH dehydrogenase subunit 4 [Belyta sp. ZJUH_2016005]